MEYYAVNQMGNEWGYFTLNFFKILLEIKSYPVELEFLAFFYEIICLFNSYKRDGK